jgi:hypothetical protein
MSQALKPESDAVGEVTSWIDVDVPHSVDPSRLPHASVSQSADRSSCTGMPPSVEPSRLPNAYVSQSSGETMSLVPWNQDPGMLSLPPIFQRLEKEFGGDDAPQRALNPPVPYF